jgi:hypothetical protein
MGTKNHETTKTIRNKCTSVWLGGGARWLFNAGSGKQTGYFDATIFWLLLAFATDRVGIG